MQTLLYQPGPATDELLLSWYTRLLALGDLHTTFFPQAWSLSGFFKTFLQRSTELLFALNDDDTVWAAVWIDSSQGAHFLGLWVDPKYRSTVRAGRLLWRWHSHLIDTYPSLHCLTQQPHVVALAEGLGYTNHGAIPGLWAGTAPATLLSFTKETATYGRQRRQQLRPQRHQD